MAKDEMKKVRASKSKKGKMMVIGISLGGAGFFLALAMFSAIGALPLPMEALDYGILALIVMMGPYGFYFASQSKNIKQVEEHLPDFLRDVAEAGRFGMTLADAIVVASSGRYGKLTPEIKKMAAQINWGIPATEALRMFAERIKTPLVNRMMAIVIKASDAGGNVADVLTMVSHDTKEAQLMAKEKKIVMSTYVAVIYIAFIVFLVTILIMNATFLPQMQKAGEGLSGLKTEGEEEAGEEEEAEESAMSGSSLINTDVIPEIGFIFFLAALFHAIGDGFVAGILESGQMLAGLRHSFFMVIIAFLMLRLI